MRPTRMWEGRTTQEQLSGGRSKAAGLDGQTIEAFEADLKGNLSKLWNRLASGSYFPSPVLRVEIPKADGRVFPISFGRALLSERTA